MFVLCGITCHLFVAKPVRMGPGSRQTHHTCFQLSNTNDFILTSYSVFRSRLEGNHLTAGLSVSRE